MTNRSISETITRKRGTFAFPTRSSRRFLAALFPIACRTPGKRRAVANVIQAIPSPANRTSKCIGLMAAIAAPGRYFLTESSTSLDTLNVIAEMILSKGGKVSLMPGALPETS